MGLTAAAAAWVVAVGAAVAVGGHRVGGVTVPPVAYAVGLGLIAAVAVAGPPRREVSLPERWRNPAAAALVFGALYAFSGDPSGTWASSVPAAAGLLVPAVAVLWPRPAAVRAGVGLAVLSLLASGSRATDAPLALGAVALAAAVALVATNRVAAGSGPVLGGAAPPSPRRVGAHVGAVVAVLAVAALLSTLVDPPPREAPPRTGDGPEAPAPAEPAPLAFDDVLDPRAEGPAAGRDGDDVLLRIRAPRADVWRAVAYDHWDGRHWRRDRAGGAGAVGRGARFVPVPGAPLRDGPTQDSSQDVRVEAAWAEVAVGAPEVQYLEVPEAAQVGPDGSVRLVPPLGRGGSYRAHSMRAVTGEAELRAAGTDPDAGVGTGDLLDAGPLGARARDLAARVTAGASTDYDRVRALERWLDENVAVDDDAPALAPGTDPVDDVVLARRAAPPERLAATLAVLARSVGVPARVAAGFLPGERPLLGGRFVVRARHAHTWVEVPFAGLGWQRFDPTGRIARAEASDSLAERLKRLLARWWPVLVALALAAAAAVAWRLVARRRRLLAQPWATRCFARLTRLGADRGRPRRAAETPAEYAAALAEGVLADERVRTVGEVVTAAAWSGREPAEEARRWADEVLGEVAAATSRTSRTSRRRR